MDIKKRLLIGWIVLLQIICGSMGYITVQGKSNWYDELPLSPYTPPDWLFSVIWPILYLFLALIAAWLFQENRMEMAKKCFALNMLLNIAWSPVFFTLHATWAAFWMLVTMVALTLYLICHLWNKQKWVVTLLLLYGSWLVYATYLSAYIVLH